MRLKVLWQVAELVHMAGCTVNQEAEKGRETNLG